MSAQIAPDQIISRKEARARGLTRYFTGKPCHHGHISSRLTKNCNCVECPKEHHRREQMRQYEFTRKRRKYEASKKRREQRKECNRKHNIRRHAAVKIIRELAKQDSNLLKMIGEIYDAAR